MLIATGHERKELVKGGTHTSNTLTLNLTREL